MKLSRKRLLEEKARKTSIKYLGAQTDENLNWKDHLHDTAMKLNRAITLLFKIRNYVRFNTMKSIDFTIFDFHLNHANLIWGQNLNSSIRIATVEKKAIK